MDATHDLWLKDYPEHTKRSMGVLYDHQLLNNEKDRMRQEHNKIQKELPKPIPFDEWYKRTWM